MRSVARQARAVGDKHDFLQALRQKALRLDLFASSGLLSVCLRSLAANDDPLRALAYEAVASYAEQLAGSADSKAGFRWLCNPAMRDQ